MASQPEELTVTRSSLRSNISYVENPPLESRKNKSLKSHTTENRAHSTPVLEPQPSTSTASPVVAWVEKNYSGPSVVQAAAKQLHKVKSYITKKNSTAIKPGNADNDDDPLNNSFYHDTLDHISETSEMANQDIDNDLALALLQSVPVFNGDRDTAIDGWLNQITTIMDVTSWTDKQKLRVVASKLTGRPLDIFQNLSTGENPDLTEIITEFAKQISPALESFYVREFLEGKQKPGETVPDFAFRLKTLYNKAFPDEQNDAIKQARLKDHFVNGLDIFIRFKFQDCKDKYATFDALVTAAYQADLAKKAKKEELSRTNYVNAITHPSSEMETLCEAIHKLTTNISAINEKQASTIEKLDKLTNPMQNRFSPKPYRGKTNFYRNNVDRRNYQDIICRFCGKNGHETRNCRARRTQEFQKEIICFKCKQKGHYATNCRNSRYQYDFHARRYGEQEN